MPRGPPASLRSDIGPACTASEVRSGLQRLGGTTRFIAPGSPWENGSGESCTGTLRDAGLDPEIFTTRTEVQILIARWHREDNQVWTHSALGARPPAPQKRWRSDLPTPPPGQTGGSQHSLQHWHNNRGQVIAVFPRRCGTDPLG